MNKEQILGRVHDYVKERTEPKKFIPSVDEVPVSGTVFSAMDITRLVDVALDGWVTEGKQADLFATKLAKFTGIPRVTLCNSGSSANLLAVTALVDLYGTPRELSNCNKCISISNYCCSNYTEWNDSILCRCRHFYSKSIHE